MNKHSLTVMTVVVFALGLVALGADDPFVGTWKADLAKSTSGAAGSAKSLTLRIEPDGKGLKYERHRVDVDGTEINDSLTVRLDSKDYPVPGQPTTNTLSSTRADTNRMTWVIKVDGRQLQLLTLVIAKDGKTMTIDIDTRGERGQDSRATLVYDKQ